MGTVELTSVKKERKPNRGKMKIQLFVVLISVAVVLSQNSSPTPTTSSTKAPTTASKATSTTKAPTTASKATSTTGTNKPPATTSGASSYGAVAISFLFTSFMVKFS